MGSGISTNVQKSVSKAVNDATVKFASENVGECFSRLDQTFKLAVENSNLTIGGDFELSQRAKMAFSCIQQQENSVELVENLLADIKKTVEQDIKKQAFSLISTDIQLTDTDISNIVNTDVKIDNKQVCNASLSQDAAINIKNSDVNVGTCDKKTLEANTAACIQQDQTQASLAMAAAVAGKNFVYQQPPTCVALQDCALKVGKFLVDQGIEFTSGCDQLQTVSATITKNLLSTIDEKMLNKQRPFELFSTEMIIAIVVGVAVVAIIGGLIAYFRWRSSKKSAEAKQLEQNYGPQSSTPYYREPTGYGEELGTSYSSYGS